jgi:PAS domain S-box-containing protein
MTDHLSRLPLTSAFRCAALAALGKFFERSLSVRAFSRLSIPVRITVIVLGLALPLNLVIAAVIWRLSDAANETQRTSLLYTARSVAAAVDAKLEQYIALAQAVAQSPAVLQDNLDVFEAEARRAFASSSDAVVLVADLEGQQLISTAREHGQPPSVRTPLGFAEQKRAFETHAIVITDARQSTVSSAWGISIEVPIFKNGQPFRALSVNVKAVSFFGLLNTQEMPKNWHACIVDRTGRYLARIPDNEHYAGQFTPAGWPEAKDRSGILEMLSRDGDPVLSARVYSALSGWTIGIAVKKAEMQLAVWDAIRWAAMLGGGFSALSLLFAGIMARSITCPIARLRREAGRLLAEPVPSIPPAGPPEVSDLWQALKQSAQARQASEEKLCLALDAAKLGIWHRNLRQGTDEMEWDNRCRTLFGLPPDAHASYETWANFIVPEDRARAKANVTRALDPDDPLDQAAFEYRVAHPDGTIRWYCSTGRAFFEPDPQCRSGRRAVFTAGVIRDVTDIRVAEAALSESEERFRGIYDNAATGIAILDMDHRFECCNPAYAKLLGYSEQELRELAFLSHLHPEDRDANAAQCQRLLAEEISHFEIVNRYVRKDGTPIWVDKHISLLYDAAGKPTNILTLATDVTERKRQEDQIRLLMREVNHRSKNMLTVVQAIARQTLAADPDDFLDRFGKRVEALAANQDLLVKNAWKGADLNELVRSQLATFEDLIGTNIKLQGPPLFVSAPAAQALGMALHELVTNAGKYGALSAAGGRVDIAWCIQRNEEDKEIFIMSWREYCAHPIMPPGKQGFGSFVISNMAEISLGACVELDYPSAGVTWQLRCAAGEVVEGSAGPVPTVGKESSSAGRGNLTSRRPRVLVVEDEALVAIEITHALTRAGFEVVGPARSVPVAIQLLKCSGCDAAVLDINLGGETSEAIAIELSANKTPFVTLSGYSPEQHHAVFAGAPALRKPLRLQLLITELSKCIEHRDSGSVERPAHLPIGQ